MKINRNRLREELRKAPVYKLPEKGNGWRYVYERLYAPFMHNREISLGALDFMAFTTDDVLELLEEFFRHASGLGAEFVTGKALSLLAWNGFSVTVGSQV